MTRAERTWRLRRNCLPLQIVFYSPSVLNQESVSVERHWKEDKEGLSVVALAEHPDIDIRGKVRVSSLNQPNIDRLHRCSIRN